MTPPGEDAHPLRCIMTAYARRRACTMGFFLLAWTFVLSPFSNWCFRPTPRTSPTAACLVFTPLHGLTARSRRPPPESADRAAPATRSARGTPRCGDHVSARGEKDRCIAERRPGCFSRCGRLLDSRVKKSRTDVSDLWEGAHRTKLKSYLVKNDTYLKCFK